jgi:hypothetical protein
MHKCIFLVTSPVYVCILTHTHILPPCCPFCFLLVSCTDFLIQTTSNKQQTTNNKIQNAKYKMQNTQYKVNAPVLLPRYHQTHISHNSSQRRTKCQSSYHSDAVQYIRQDLARSQFPSNSHSVDL